MLQPKLLSSADILDLWTKDSILFTLPSAARQVHCALSSERFIQNEDCAKFKMACIQTLLEYGGWIVHAGLMNDRNFLEGVRLEAN